MNSPFATQNSLFATQHQATAYLDTQASPVTGSVWDISPELAKQLIANNSINRPISRKHMKSIAKDMAAGRWRLNGEAIVISKSKKILDGQHRLLAVIESGVTIQVFVVTGVPDDAMPTFGGAKRRSAGDVLAMHGYSNSNTLSGVTRQFALLEAGLPGAKLPISPMEEMELIAKHPAIEKATHWLSSNSVIRRSAVGAAYAYLLVKCASCGADPDPVDDFFEQLKSGVGMSANSPVYALRNRLERLAHGDCDNNRELIGLVFKAWSLHKRGAKVSRLTMDGSIPEVQV